MNISKPGGDGEVRANFTQGFVDVINILGLSVERIIVNRLIIDPVFFAAGYSNLLLAL